MKRLVPVTISPGPAQASPAPDEAGPGLRAHDLRAYDWYGDARVAVIDLGLACCAVEFEATVRERPEWGVRERAEGDGSGNDADKRPESAVVVVSGTVPDALVPVVCGAITRAEQAMGCPVRVVAYGACASSGGPYWDSYAVANGIGQFVPVAAYVPGCPPPPGSLEEAIDGVAGGAR